MNKVRKIVAGSVLGIICPSGHPKSLDEVNKFCNLLTEYGYKYKLGKSVTAVEGYLAGSDTLRAKDLMDMFLDDDVTVLLNTLYQFSNMPTVHGEMGVCMQNYEEFTFNHFFEMLENGFINPLVNPTLPLNVINEGICEGVVVGGNLSLIYALMGTPYEIDLNDKILFIEEVNEAPYAVDRMLSSLSLSGKLNKLKGIICGYFTGCESSSNQTVNELLEHYFKPLNIPFVTNFQSGHNKPFINLPIGLNVRLDTYKKSVTVLESLYQD